MSSSWLEILTYHIILRQQRYQVCLHLLLHVNLRQPCFQAYLPLRQRASQIQLGQIYSADRPQPQPAEDYSGRRSKMEICLVNKIIKKALQDFSEQKQIQMAWQSKMVLQIYLETLALETLHKKKKRKKLLDSHLDNKHKLKSVDKILKTKK